MNRLQEIGNICGVNLSDLENIFPVPVGEICERIGLNVEFCNLPNGQAGKLVGNTMQVNDNYAGTRNLFTIAHEIGHYIINKNTNQANDNNRFDDKKKYSKEQLAEEKRANEFAAELLMPTEIFTNKFLQFKKGDFKYTKLSQFFKVSKEACLYRALNLGLSDNV